ncbi:hypothetical protein [Bradyrhizobium japonicum]|uniref:hypothetical protein n=1 Tax=Bradyrhizobium japonicum TaxID=375 RepID=UPI001BA87E1C|nr:hypothetical protein [Bradyrhizobium japonicum]
MSDALPSGEEDLAWRVSCEDIAIRQSEQPLISADLLGAGEGLPRAKRRFSRRCRRQSVDELVGRARHRWHATKQKGPGKPGPLNVDLPNDQRE